MLAGYARFMNDNVRTAHLKCPACKTRTHLTGIETDDDGREVRNFTCQRCGSVNRLVLPGASQAVESLARRDLGGN